VPTDGLRGIAAFLVVWHHASLLWFTGRIHNGYGSSETDNLFIQWPFIRLLVSGPPQVMVFFVISGYALSYKPLKLARQGRFAEFNDALASSAFRRHSRLWLPPLATTFLSMLMAWFGWYGTGGNWPGVAQASRRPKDMGSLGGYLVEWAMRGAKMMDPISRDTNRSSNNPYDLNLWTLAYEFDCSLVVFLTIAAFSRLRNSVRLFFEFAVVCFCLYKGYWQVFLFLSGTFMCDFKFHLESYSSSSSSTKPSGVLPAHSRSASSVSVPLSPPTSPRFRPTSRLGLVWKLLWTVSFVLALFMLGMPEFGRGARNTPGYKTIATWVPKHYEKGPDWFFVPVAAVWLVFTVDRAPWLQSIFNRAFPQYLARISYSLYLVHGPLLWTAGLALAKLCVGLTGRASDAQYCVGIALSALLFWPLAIWSADMVWRYIDTKAVDFGKWVYERLAKSAEADARLLREKP